MAPKARTFCILMSKRCMPRTPHGAAVALLRIGCLPPVCEHQCVIGHPCQHPLPLYVGCAKTNFNHSPIVKEGLSWGMFSEQKKPSRTICICNVKTKWAALATGTVRPPAV